MTEKTIEWNLGFAHEEVVVGLEKMLTKAGYAYSRTDASPAVHFQITLPQGTCELHARPLLSHRSPFSPQIILHRTLLVITCTGVSAQDEQALLHRLTLAFLRVGG